MNHPLHHLRPHHKPPSSRHQSRLRRRAPLQARSRMTFASTKKMQKTELMLLHKYNRGLCSRPAMHRNSNAISLATSEPTVGQLHHHMQTSHRSQDRSGNTRDDHLSRAINAPRSSNDNATARSTLSRASSVSYSYTHAPLSKIDHELRISLLEDSATQMVEVIWPLSMSPCRSEGGAEKSVLPLRSYIEETLRRSKTSYSTLQVALYYLVLIKYYVPKRDFTQEQGMDCPATRALMCGRRMFLAALILASKYLQDRNYSAKAWSKMSGLKVCEINFNERTFLSKIGWKLHIPEPLFKKWTDVVLEFTPHPPPPPSPGQSFSILPPTWKSIIPLLTPELDRVPVTGLKHQRSMQCMGNYGNSGLSTPTTPTPTKPRWNPLLVDQLESASHEGTPTPSTVVPRYLEPAPAMEPPTLPRMGPLPTPQMTPSTVATNTPAASACSSRRPSIASAMAMATSNAFNRCTMDAYPCSREQAFSSRRPSITSASSRSSPESMMSDRSRSSRASSISSISTVSTNSSLAPNSRACLARQATCRNAGLPVPPPATVYEEKEGSATKPIIINEDADIMSSPDMADFSISEKVLSRPDKHSKHGSSASHQAILAPAASRQSRKRCRSWRQSGGHRRLDLQEEVREMLEEAEEDLMDIDTNDDDGSDSNGSDSENLTPSPAVEYAARILSRSNSNSIVVGRTKEVQPPATLSRSGSGRMPVQRCEGSMKKRTCCSTDYAAANAAAQGMERALLYGEVS